MIISKNDIFFDLRLAYKKRFHIENVANTQLKSQVLKYTFLYKDWWHNHYIGIGNSLGKQEDRHIKLISNFMLSCNLPKNLEGKTVLDIGPGTGGTSYILSALGATVTCVEINLEYCNLIKTFSSAYNLNITCVNDTIQNYLLYSSEKYDYINFSGVLYFLKNQKFIFDQLHNSLNNNGILLVNSFGVISEEKYDTCHSEKLNVPSVDDLYQLSNLFKLKEYSYHANDRILGYPQIYGYAIKGILK